MFKSDEAKKAELAANVETQAQIANMIDPTEYDQEAIETEFGNNKEIADESGL